MCIYCVIAAYICSRFYSESLAHIYPSAEFEDISYLTGSSRADLTEEDYRLIFRQTGLGKTAVSKLSSLSELAEYQRAYFGEAKFKCVRNSPVSCEERASEPLVRFADIENGDILVTRSSHILSWRNGHAAIVVDAEKGTTLEAVVIGQPSSFQHISKWEKYPNVAVLRLKGASAELRKKIAAFAAENLENKPYNAAVGVFTPKYSAAGRTEGTQCAHLVWTAYAAYGFDIDGNKGLIVTPKDIAESSCLETVQTYGY